MAEDSPAADSFDSGPPVTPGRIGWWWLGFAGIAGLVGVTVALAVPFTATRTLMDPVTGATCEQQNVMFGGGVYRNTQATALSRWLEHREPAYEPAWAGVSLRRRNVFGGLVSFRDDPVPAIAALKASPDLKASPALKASLVGWATPLEVFVESASDERILAFVRAMRHGSKAERAEAVDGVLERLRSPVSASDQPDG